MASARVAKTAKAPKAPPPPVATQKDRALAAIARMPSFDKYWLEKLHEAILREDSSFEPGEYLRMTRLYDHALTHNEMRAKFPKPWVTT
jgi:hypothetical protein